MLVARQLAKSFGQIEALRGVSLNLVAGEIRGVCGENGAGKSTLMKLLMGIINPDSGVIEIDGRPRNYRKSAKGAGTWFSASSPGTKPSPGPVCARQHMAREPKHSFLTTARQIPTSRQ